MAKQFFFLEHKGYRTTLVRHLSLERLARKNIVFKKEIKVFMKK